MAPATTVKAENTDGTNPAARLASTPDPNRVAPGQRQEGRTVAAEKIAPQEYRAAGQKLTVGQPASKAVYLDASGNPTTDPPEEGVVLVAEGDTVEQHMVDRLSA